MTPLIAVIATGGTIASRQSDGGAAPDLDGAALLSRLRNPPQVRLRAVDVFARDSSTLGLEEMETIVDAIGAQLRDPDVSGVVVLHGTDSMEETLLLAQLRHPGKPVVFTGAQRTDDHPAPDGPDNLAAALTEVMRPGGVRLAFGGRVLPAWAIYKHAAQDRDAFRSTVEAPAPELHLTATVRGIRVDVVAVHPGGDGLHIRASLAAGAQGIVLSALGSGNATPDVVAAVAECQAANVPVIVSSRVPTGTLAPAYGGGGGGQDLARAGAVHASVLRPGQARILLAALIAEGRSDLLPVIF